MNVRTNRFIPLATLIAFLIVAFFGCSQSEQKIPAANADAKVIVVAFDGLDPKLATQWMDQGILPNMSKLRKEGGFSTLGTSVPPQSPVAWSNFITGKNPGGHGIFDFIHRDPKSYLPYLSTSKTSEPGKFFKIAGYKIPTDGGEVTLLRKGKAFWEYLGQAGIDTTIFCVPSNYPPVEGPFKTLAGMGTPDLLGGYGMFSYFTTDPPKPKPGEEITGGKVYPVEVINGKVGGRILGPKNTFIDLPKGERAPDSEVPFTVFLDPDSDAALIEIEDERILLKKGEWSDWVQIKFEMVPLLVSVKGMVRFLLKSTRPFALYVSPINIDPRDPALPISTPPEYAAKLAEVHGGPFHTQGIPEDTKALSNEILDNGEFLQQAWTVLDERLDLYRYQLSQFHKGFLFFYFSSSDQLSHMFWRTMDKEHPAYDSTKDSAYTNIMKEVYIRMDKALGEAIEKAGTDTTLIVMSDHGFAPYYKSFHLSSWLLDNGYLTLVDPTERDSDFLMNVEWMGTKAYTLGINGLYLNLIGREDMGIVRPASADKLLDELVEKLEAITDPETGQKVILKAYKTSEVYKGQHTENAPDLIIGYASGYRSSWETALGKFPEGDLLRPNEDEWSGDHCMAASEVPGSLFVNRPLKLKNPKLYDLPVTIIELFGIQRPTDMIGHNLFEGK